MLVLTRKMGETIQIGDDVQLTVLRIKGNTVRIGIEAPANVRVRRGEIPPKSEFTEMTLVMSDDAEPTAMNEWQVDSAGRVTDAAGNEHVPPTEVRREVVQLADIVRRVRQTPLRTLQRAMGAE